MSSDPLSASENGSDDGKVSRDDYHVALTQATSLGQKVRLMERREKKSNTQLDIIRRLLQIGILVVLILLTISLFVTHPLLNSPHKTPIVGALAAICIGYAVALDFAKGNFGVLLFLIVGGISVFMFTFGHVTCQLQGAA